MKKQASKKEVENLVVELLAKGWTQSEVNPLFSEIVQIKSPVSSFYSFVIVTINGRAIRLDYSFGGRRIQKSNGLSNFRRILALIEPDFEKFGIVSK